MQTNRSRRIWMRDQRETLQRERYSRTLSYNRETARFIDDQRPWTLRAKHPNSLFARDENPTRPSIPRRVCAG